MASPVPFTLATCAFVEDHTDLGRDVDVAAVTEVTSSCEGLGRAGIRDGRILWSHYYFNERRGVHSKVRGTLNSA